MRRRILLAAIATAVLVLAGWLISVLTAPREGIEFVVSPMHAVAQIDGETYTVRSGERIGLRPGTYAVRVSADGFSEDSQSLTVVKGKFVQFVAALKPQSAAATKLLNQPDEQQNRERVGGLLVSQGGRRLSTQYPWIDKLPINGDYFYAYPCTPQGTDTSLDVCVILYRDDATVRDEAVSALRNAGVDTGTVVVQFESGQ